MGKIRFIKPVGRKPGVTRRCAALHPRREAVHCMRPESHAGKHAWSKRSLRAAPGEPPKKKKLRTLSQETKLSCLEMIEDPLYRKQLLRDLRARNLRPAVECMLWYYAKGKPKEMVEHSGTLSLQEELASLTPEELRARALSVAKMLTTTVH